MHKQSQKYQRLCLGIAFAVILFLPACGAIPSATTPVHGVSPPARPPATYTPVPSTPTHASSPTAPVVQHLMLRVPSRWADSAYRAVAAAQETGDTTIWQVEISDESTDQKVSEQPTVQLVPGYEGILIVDHPLALAVPLASDWGDLSLEEAEEFVQNESPFMLPMDWSELNPAMRSLRVEGWHPSHPEYPLRETWSLVAPPELEPSTRQLAAAWKEIINPDPVIHIAAVGDVVLARSLGDSLAEGDGEDPFAGVLGFLQEADLTVGNLESALGTSGNPEKKGYTFQAPPQAAQTLAAAGFDLMSLANNHAMDYGAASLLEGITLLTNAGIGSVGAGENLGAARSPVIFDIEGLRVAFLAYVDVPVEFRGFDAHSWVATDTKPGVSWADPEIMEQDITAAHQSADFVIVLLHSGYEYVQLPSPPQTLAAEKAVEAGADVVLGHHSHIVQPIQIIGDQLVAYGLGNFAFPDGGVTDSMLLQLWVDPDGLREIEFVPIVVSEEGHPTIPEQPQRGELWRGIVDLTSISQQPDASPTP